MKKHLLTLLLLLPGIIGMYSCTKEIEDAEYPGAQQQTPDKSPAGDYVPGQMVIKLTREPAEVKTIQTRSGETRIETGLKTIDEICAAIGASSMKRVFRSAGKHEERSREAGLHLWYVVEFPEEVSMTRAVSGFSDNEYIASAEPAYIASLPTDSSIPVSASSFQGTTRSSSLPFNDPLLGQQWHYRNLGNITGSTAGADINLFDAWTQSVGHPDVIVAIVDSGIQFDHPDLAENMWINTGEIPGNGIDDDHNGYVDDYYGYNFADDTGTIVPDNHGTHVAGIIAAVNNNGIGTSGIAGGDKATNRKGVRLMSCQIFPGSHTVPYYKIAEAIVYGADNGAVISQNSWGATNYCSELKAAVDYFVEHAGIENGRQTGPMKGGIVIAAAMNASSQTPFYPAALSNVVSVAAIDPAFKIGAYSNYGSWIDVTAPGGYHTTGARGVISTVAGGGYGGDYGTSMACPHVSGVAALVVSKYGVGQAGLTPKAVKTALLESSNPEQLYRYNPRYNGQLGKGLLDSGKALSEKPEEPFLFGVMFINVNDLSHTYNYTLWKGGENNRNQYTEKTNGSIFLKAGEIHLTEIIWSDIKSNFIELAPGTYTFCVNIDGIHEKTLTFTHTLPGDECFGYCSNFDEGIHLNFINSDGPMWEMEW